MVLRLTCNFTILIGLHSPPLREKFYWSIPPSFPHHLTAILLGDSAGNTMKDGCYAEKYLSVALSTIPNVSSTSTVCRCVLFPRKHSIPPLPSLKKLSHAISSNDFLCGRRILSVLFHTGTHTQITCINFTPGVISVLLLNTSLHSENNPHNMVGTKCACLRES